MALTHEDKLQIAQAVQLQLENADGSSGAMRWKGSGGAALVSIESSKLDIAQKVSIFPVWGTEVTKSAWPTTSGVAYSFPAVDVGDMSSIYLAILLDTGSATINIDIGWSSTGSASDIHTTDTGVISGSGTGLGAVVTKKDLFMHIIATQTATTLEDAYIYVSGKNRA